MTCVQHSWLPLERLSRRRLLIAQYALSQQAPRAVALAAERLPRLTFTSGSVGRRPAVTAHRRSPAKQETRARTGVVEFGPKGRARWRDSYRRDPAARGGLPPARGGRGGGSCSAAGTRISSATASSLHRAEGRAQMGHRWVQALRLSCLRLTGRSLIFTWSLRELAVVPPASPMSSPLAACIAGRSADGDGLGWGAEPIVRAGSTQGTKGGRLLASHPELRGPGWGGLRAVGGGRAMPAGRRGRARRGLIRRGGDPVQRCSEAPWLGRTRRG